MWTMDNTDGFTQTELDMINSVIERVSADAPGIEDSNLSDAVNNEWCAGIAEADLEAAVRGRLGLPKPHEAA